MLSCEPTGVMVHQSSTQNPSVSGGAAWIHPIIKQETPNGFLSNSEGFHSASPSSSSRDSNPHSPISVDSGDGHSPGFYDSTPLQNRSQGSFSIGFHQSMTMGFNPLTPPSVDGSSRLPDLRTANMGYSQDHRSPINSMRNNIILPSIGTPSSNVTPPKSPEVKLVTSDQAVTENVDYRNYYDPNRVHCSDNDHIPVKSETDKSDECDRSDDSAGEELEGDDEPGLRTPAVNSHGKVKTFKCKQCEFVAVTKLDFWDHSKEHIKPEKMLTCPKCPFVTEYKHHLEYHMRNHFGSKPFQCNQCSYSCVNKSMLNSHLKSHSNIYQYRCSDCSYATKYCHSLKLHLRKYQHHPAMVLNQDGSPNPFPIIDVYGTRRGPKQKTQLKIQEEVSQTVSHTNTLPLFQNPFALNFPYAPLLTHPLLFPTNHFQDSLAQKILDKSTPSVEERQNIDPPVAAPLLQQRLLYGEKLPYTFSSPLMNRVHSPVREISDNHEPSPPKLPISPLRQVKDTNTDALDLTSFKSHGAESPAPSNSTSIVPLTPTTSLKNRRKGRAFKLERSSTMINNNDDMVGCDDETLPLETADSTSPENKVRDIATRRADDDESDVSLDGSSPGTTNDDLGNNGSKKSPNYDCQYCSIIFKDIIMYTMHMGYHGYKDPFTCNMCGVRSTDKVSFFIHIARTQHS